MAITEVDSLRGRLRELLPELKTEFGVGKLWIVGSRARGDNRPDSDLDLMVGFERRGISLIGFCRLERVLSEALGLKVDLVEEGAMNPRVSDSTARDALAV